MCRLYTTFTPGAAMMHRSHRFAALFAVVACLALDRPAAAQPPAPAPTTGVLATLTVKNDAARDEIAKVMADEVRLTVQMYLDGKIQQWYARGDGRGVV